MRRSLTRRGTTGRSLPFSDRSMSRSSTNSLRRCVRCSGMRARHWHRWRQFLWRREGSKCVERRDVALVASDGLAAHSSIPRKANRNPTEATWRRRSTYSALREARTSRRDRLRPGSRSSKLLGAHPELLDGEQMRPGDSRRWLLVKREMGIPDTPDAASRWSVDHLLIDQDGLPTLVEVKRGTDTRVRREVVGQCSSTQPTWRRHGRCRTSVQPSRKQARTFKTP